MALARFDNNNNQIKATGVLYEAFAVCDGMQLILIIANNNLYAYSWYNRR